MFIFEGLVKAVGNSMNKVFLTVVIPARNEEKMLPECIKSVSWAEEIIVVDNASEDKTAGVARGLGAKLIYCKRFGIDYSKPRNLGAKEASGEWLLYIDADELVTAGLREEVEKVIKNPAFSAFAIPRQNIFLGHPMRHGGWWPDRVLRLIKKDQLKGWSGNLHEQPEITGKIGKLSNPLIHITHRSLSEMIKKTNEWSNLEAVLLFKAHHPKMTWWRFISVALREFWYRAIVKLGFLDGPVGIIEIVYQMFSRMITYAKLWELQLTSTKKLT